MENKMEEIINNNPIAENVGNNQIFLPKNSVPVQPVANTNANVAPDANINQLSVSNSNYYTLFGIEVSKTTIYIIVLFLIVVAGYYYYKNRSQEDDKKKKKKKDKKSKDDNKSKTTSTEESN